MRSFGDGRCLAEHVGDPVGCGKPGEQLGQVDRQRAERTGSPLPEGPDGHHVADQQCPVGGSPRADEQEEERGEECHVRTECIAEPVLELDHVFAAVTDVGGLTGDLCRRSTFAGVCLDQRVEAEQLGEHAGRCADLVAHLTIQTSLPRQHQSAGNRADGEQRERHDRDHRDRSRR